MRIVTRVFAVSFGIACAAPGSAETLLERDIRLAQAASDAGWVFNSAHDGICSIDDMRFEQIRLRGYDPHAVLKGEVAV